jgi:hypothetical protein
MISESNSTKDGWWISSLEHVTIVFGAGSSGADGSNFLTEIHQSL